MQYLGLPYCTPWSLPSTEAPWDTIGYAPDTQGNTVEGTTETSPPAPEAMPQRPALVRIDGGQQRIDGGQQRIDAAQQRIDRAQQHRRLLPKDPQSGPATTQHSAPRALSPRRISACNYSAVEIHGFFGLIDDGSDASGRVLIVHIPKWVRGHSLDIRQGDTLHVNSADGKMGGVLTVLSTGRHRYYSPGRKVSTCTICVPEEQWAPFARG